MTDFWPGTTDRLVADAMMRPTTHWRIVPVRQHEYRGFAIFRNGRRLWSKPTIREAMNYIRRHV